MIDQATELRNLVLRSARPTSRPADAAPRLIVMSGGKGGVGTTTVAVNLAVALVEQGQRTVLVDADMVRADVAPLCGLPEQYNVADILAARRDIHEVLERGPAGVQVVPGLWAPATQATCTAHGQARLLSQLASLGRHADWIVIDAGSGPTPVARRFWEAADDVLVVATPDPLSVMDSYATIKSLARMELSATTVRLIVNQVRQDGEAQDTFARINRSCQRFLARELSWLGPIASDPQLAAAALQARPAVLACPQTAAVQDLLRIANVLHTTHRARQGGPTMG